jgi:CYTH domain-containing protein
MKNMEIERKFLIQKLPKGLDVIKSFEIKQGYITNILDSVEVRIREQGMVYYITIKQGSGMIRRENEVEITAGQFTLLWKITSQKRIEKTRKLIKLNSTTAEIDIYKGQNRGLIVAEVEFKTVSQAKKFIAPEWFGKEVTSDAKFKNKFLAK